MLQSHCFRGKIIHKTKEKQLLIYKKKISPLIIEIPLTSPNLHLPFGQDKEPKKRTDIVWIWSGKLCEDRLKRILIK
jgi:hypothetical protein